TADLVAFAIQHGDLQPVTNRGQGHEDAIAAARKSHEPTAAAGGNGVGHGVDMLRLAEHEITAGVDVDRHDAPLGAEVVVLRAVDVPLSYAECAFRGQLPPFVLTAGLGRRSGSRSRHVVLV